MCVHRDKVIIYFMRITKLHVVYRFMAAEVEVNENGLPVSLNATKLGHRKGTLVCTHVPVSFKNWKHVHKKYKDDVWNELKGVYSLPETSKKNMVKSMAEPWRRFKHELRVDHYDI